MLKFFVCDVGRWYQPKHKANAMLQFAEDHDIVFLKYRQNVQIWKAFFKKESKIKNLLKFVSNTYFSIKLGFHLILKIVKTFVIV